MKKHKLKVAIVATLVIFFAFIPVEEVRAGTLEKLEKVKFLWGSQYFPYLKDKLEKAREEVIVYQYLIQGRKYVPELQELLDLLREKANAGVDVKFYTDGSRKNLRGRSVNEAIQNYFDTVPVQFKILPEEKVMHSKVVIIDGEAAFVGSQNWTKRGLTQNIETAIYTADTGFASSLKQKLRNSLKVEEEKAHPLKPAEESLETVDRKQLLTVPQIGPHYADKIIEYRRQEGELENIECLKYIDGIGEKRLRILRYYFGDREE